MSLKPDYSWLETESHVQVSVPLKGNKASTVDVYATEYLLKVSFSPYILALDLYGAVDEARSKATAKKGVLTIKISKKQPGIWGQLTAEGTKQELKERREASIQAQRKREEELMEAKRDLRTAEDRQATRDQMAVDAAQRQRLDDLKAEEKAREEAAMYRAFAEMESKKTQPAPAEKKIKKMPVPSNAPQRVRFADELATEGGGGGSGGPVGGGKGALSEAELDRLLAEGSDDEEGAAAAGRRGGGGGGGEEEEEEEEEEEGEEWEADGGGAPAGGGADLDDAACVPAPRASTKVAMDFTRRLFPTPARESKARDEEDWIIKNRVALKKNKANANKLPAHLADISETDAYWLKAKGDDFFKAKDYASAAAAYTSALEGDPESLPALANRAACRLKLLDFTQCILDCSKALEINQTHRRRTPEEKLAFKAKLLVRRGTAYCQLAIYDQALSDYREAVQTDPTNQDLVADLQRLRRLAECYELKKQGDAAFAEGDMEGAKQKYTEALLIEEKFVSCLSNRAACRMALNDLEGCIEDCSASLALLEWEDGEGGGKTIEELGGEDGGGAHIPLRPAGQKRNRWLLATVCRRGAARARAGDLVGALRDHERALRLDPDNPDLQRDAAELRFALGKAEGEAAAGGGGGEEQ